MQRFKTTHSDYESYRSEHYQVADIPDDLWSGLKGLIIRHCDGADSLKAVVNAILTIVPTGPTNNWGYGFLQDDLDHAIRQIRGKPFARAMDAIGSVYEELLYTPFGDDLEELLEETGLGYYVDRDPLSGSYWALRDEDTVSVAAEIDDAQREVKGVCEQALEHLEQAKANLKKGDERSRKDAVRDAMSAMEAMYKSLAGASDIADAYKALRDQGMWGPDIIVKDGYSMWNHLHHTYPDIRHGQASSSSLSDEEAHYWIVRILTFMRYMAKKQS